MKAFGGLLVAGAIGLGLPAHSIPITQSLAFTAADQSLWGPGAVNLGFDYTRSTSVPLPFGLGSASVGYSVGASAGQVGGTVNGNLTTNYTPTLSSPGTANIDLSFLGGASNLHSTLGAHAQLTSSLGNVGPDFQLDINKNFTAALDQTVSGSDSIDPVATLAIADIGVASAGVALGVTQTDEFRATGIGGSLFYSRQGSALTQSLGFTLDTAAGLSLAIDLLDVGIWDFWLGDLALLNSFSTSLALDLGVYADAILGCGDFGLSSCYTSYTLLSPTIYDGDSFALAFNKIGLDRFTVEVAMPVPEPTTLSLLGLGLFGFGALRLRRRA